jgi:hypothetical protein
MLGTTWPPMGQLVMCTEGEGGACHLRQAPGRHCCIKAKGVLAVPQSGDAGPSDTLENRNKPGI